MLDIKPEQQVVFERFSDSAGGYIVLNKASPQAFKTLIRAAKAKGKLRLKATVSPLAPSPQEKEAVVKDDKPAVTQKPIKYSNLHDLLGNEVQPLRVPQPSQPRDSVSLDRRVIGSGIFDFREARARASQQTLVNDEAPVPYPFVDQVTFFDDLKSKAVQQPMPTLAIRPHQAAEPAATFGQAWSVYCNSCNKAMANIHYHCSICDGGDYDLCEECVAGGTLCHGEGHWLIKRYITDGKFINSTTERISPRQPKSIPELVKSEVTEKEMPGTFTDDAKTLNEPQVATRTCNSCVVVLPEREFVTCTHCEDFDLCIRCHLADKHGHHPAHGFKPATEDTLLPLAAENKLAPGRNVRHNAICDGCDKKIYGVRHKCLNCPDYDLCVECVQSSRQSHPHHRFAPLYAPIADQCASTVHHFGIYCDGPLCSTSSNTSYIQGVRYKCTVCHDTDFCGNCEASPSNHHNRTHPLIKLKTPVRNVSVSTENEDPRGNVRLMGDRRAQAANVATAAPVTAPSPVQTVAEIMPTEVKKETTPISVPVKKYEPVNIPVLGPKDIVKTEVPNTLLNAHFVRDSIPDGMVVEPETRFTQIWTLKNPGPYAWPAGCSVRYVGGDNMLNVDNSQPASVAAINDATESNVVGREVAVGEEVAFKVVLKAPPREGKSISYWRVKAADGTPFGHRLWCDVEVKKAEQVIVPASAQPALFHPPPTDANRIPMQMRPCGPRSSMPVPLPQLPQLAPMPSEQPPAYDSVNLSSRLAAMRQQQKQRREQMVAQLNAQRDQLQAQGMPSRQFPSWGPQDYVPSAQKGFESMSDKEKRDALRQRVAHIKANIQKTREEREKLNEDLIKQRAEAAEKKAAEETAKVQKMVLEAAKHEEAEKLEGSQMVFPKLEKESPSSSTYESAASSSVKGKAAYVENEDGEVERSASPTPVAAPLSVASPGVEEDFIDLEDDLEVLSANENDSEDDGFLTDEEYDILDASDHETVASN